MSDDFSEHGNEQVQRRTGRLRRIALGIAIGSLVGLVGVLAILLATRGEQLPEINFASFDAAKNLWDERGPQDYDLDLELSGPTPGLAHLEIRGDDIEMTLNGRPMSKRIADYHSIAGLFSVIRRDLEACAEAAKQGDRHGSISIFSRGLFDSQYGYPAVYRRITPSGTDAGWRVIRFTAK